MRYYLGDRYAFGNCLPCIIKCIIKFTNWYQIYIIRYEDI